MEINSTRTEDRILSLDFLRGIAILGILFINAENFAYPNPWDPWKFGFNSDIDTDTRFWVYFLTQGKFYNIFALLFGVGFYMFLERLQKKDLGIKAFDLYSRRLLWLFVIGLAHAYLIWEGDVLYHYAICGFLLFPFRSFSNKGIIIVIAILSLVELSNAFDLTSRRITSFEKYEASLNKPKEEWSSDEEKRVKYWEKKLVPQEPDTTYHEPKKPSYLSGLQQSYKDIKVYKGKFYHEGILLRSLIIMLVGILLYRTGIFSDLNNWKYYWPITLLVLLFALFVNYWRFHHWSYTNEIPILSYWQSAAFTFPKELLGFAYVLVLNGLYQKFLRNKLKAISNIGRMALTNYIFQNTVLGLLFYGYGAGMHNQFSRFELLGVVGSIWVIQLILSYLYLKKYKQGPLEAIWRRLTYFKSNE